MRHLVMYSGGLGSWATTMRVRESLMVDGDTLDLLFADTLVEHPDLYAFLEPSAAACGGNLIRIAEGRTPWQVFFDVRMMGSSRLDPCSRILKRELMRKWLKDNCDPADAVIYIGFSWDEAHRWERAKGHWSPWTVDAPLTRAPYLTKKQIMEWAESLGLPVACMYKQGYPHLNCSGMCIKAGQGQMKMTLLQWPAVYKEWEDKEQEFREYIGKDVSILRDQANPHGNVLTLKTLRERIEGGQSIDMFDIGGCACMEPGEDEIDA